MDDPAIDLAVVVSVLSSNADIPVDTKSCFAGEVGLSGEIRAITRVEQRITEAEKLGFQRIFISKYNLKGIDTKKFSIQIIPVKTVLQVFEMLAF